MDLISLLVTVVILAILFSALWFFGSRITIPAPFDWVPKAVIGLIIIGVLLGLLFGGISLPRWR